MSTTPPSGPGIPGGNLPPAGPPYQGPPPPPYAGGYPAGAAPQPAMQPPRKGLGPVAWILIILGGLFALFVIVLVAGGLFVAHKIHQAGRNPAIAIAKLAVAANPDAEIVSEDDNLGTLTIHDRKTGKTVTINASDIKNGKLTLTGDNNETVTIGGTGNGSTGGLEMKSNEGTVHIGNGPVKLPSWLPAYPSATVEGTMSADTAEALSGAFSFQTHDPLDKVVSFYKDVFNSAGIKESANLTTPAMTMITGQDSAQKRQISVTISPQNGENKVTITFTDKK